MKARLAARLGVFFAFFLAAFRKKYYFCIVNDIITWIMEEIKFKNRREQADYYAKLRGWGPLTEEEKVLLDDAVRLVTNLDSKPRYALPN